MASDSFDCYLCGTTNPPEADHCTSCSGQLLRLPSEESHDDEPDEFDLVGDFEDPEPPAEEPEEPKAKKSRLSPMQRRLQSAVHGSVEDQRLSDALGLSEPADESTSVEDDDGDNALDQLHTEVTSIPQTKAAENIPVIGTQGQPGTKAIHYTDDDEVGPIAYVITAMLIVATVWFGYDTLFRDRSPSPDTIAFTDTTTTTITTTTTTEAPETTVPIDEVDFRYGPTIVRAVPFDCDVGREAMADPVIAVAFDEHSVVLGNNLPAGADVVQIVTRTGNIRVGVVSNQGGINVATSNAPTTRNLGLEQLEASPASAAPAYFVGYDVEANVIYTTETSQSFDAEITVSDEGSPLDIRIGGTTFAANDLAALDISFEIDGNLPGRADVCGIAAALTPVANATSLNTDGTDDEAGENGTDADLEETDAG